MAPRHVRDATVCVYCHRTFPAGTLRADHSIPASRGGARRAEVIVAACEQCDRWKGPLTADEFLSVMPEPQHATAAQHAARRALIRAIRRAPLHPTP